MLGLKVSLIVTGILGTRPVKTVVFWGFLRNMELIVEVGQWRKEGKKSLVSNML